LGFVFGKILRSNDDDIGEIYAGGDVQVFQSNIALLNYAAKETQDRLLKLERAILGADCPTLPYGSINAITQGEKDSYDPY